MDRYLEVAGSVTPPTAPAANPEYPTKGDPLVPIPASEPGEWWFHMMTEELRAVIVAAGITPDHTNLTQLLTAIEALIPGKVLGSAIANNSASIDFTGLNLTPYSALMLFGDAITPGTAGVTLGMQLSTGGVIDAGAGSYEHKTSRWTSTASGVGGSLANSLIQLHDYETLGTAVNQSFGFDMMISDPNTTARKQATWKANGLMSSGNYVAFSGGGRWLAQNGPIDGLRLAMTSGVIATGKFFLVGLKSA